MRCKTHNIGFTLYPFGYYPYSRHTLAPVDIEGNLLTSSDDDTSLFIGTLFEAAVDAADGIAWRSQSDAGSLDMRFPTQVRHIQRATILLGIAPEISHYLREETAQILTVPGQFLDEASGQITLSKCGFKCCGNEICKLLQYIPTGSFFARLAEAGTCAGLWKAPTFVINNMLKPSSFHKVRMRGSPEKKGDH
jgi:hypothetical protein